MQADPEHVHAEPREAGDDIAEDSHDHQPTLPDESAPARMQNDRAPKHDQHCAIFLRVPAPESSPRLIGPDTTGLFRQNLKGWQNKPHRKSCPPVNRPLAFSATA